MSATYKLKYWPTIPGRGEYVRLAFRAANVAFSDDDDVSELKSFITPRAGHFAPPVLEMEENGKSFSLSQTPAILAYLAPRLGLAGDGSEEDRAAVNAITLTILDLSNETHDTHHPIATSLYYEDQKSEAKSRAHDFRQNRVPKFFGHFAKLVSENPTKSGFLHGDKVTTADLTLFQLVEGLTYAFPKYIKSLTASSKTASQVAPVFALRDKVAQHPALVKYLNSKDRRGFNEYGLFRHYAELDGEYEE
ncbi:hypothetical protein IE81DRAFT_347440 [Ceraceosorus guamensis]|uniref:GST C-terminal domain-containing protein n=1 Tax=Ceraceosorus guamensis TaxID=1522189 RepID=A0A316W191_9BASI|nr:hypothetical protein IE81DRAFT_347440 [Ceraceosorus guamensis]PWN42513.1 hypothetical protein IE81DRAFT_347440 [Ceraceosorus guamensis]